MQNEENIETKKIKIEPYSGIVIYQTIVCIIAFLVIYISKLFIPTAYGVISEFYNKKLNDPTDIKEVIFDKETSSDIFPAVSGYIDPNPVSSDNSSLESEVSSLQDTNSAP